jgi:hypothetical protein
MPVVLWLRAAGAVSLRMARASGRVLVVQLDHLLRRVYGVSEFPNDARCILRVALARARSDLTLSDGQSIRRGDLVVELHLWNERVPQTPPAGADLAWGRAFHAGFLGSLRLLATYI